MVFFSLRNVNIVMEQKSSLVPSQCTSSVFISLKCLFWGLSKGMILTPVLQTGSHGVSCLANQAGGRIIVLELHFYRQILASASQVMGKTCPPPCFINALPSGTQAAMLPPSLCLLCITEG